VKKYSEFLAWALSMIVVGIVSIKFMYETFATEKRVSQLEINITKKIEEDKSQTDKKITQLETVLERVDSRIFDLWKGKRN
jgi:hypothetical protein